MIKIQDYVHMITENDDENRKIAYFILMLNIGCTEAKILFVNMRISEMQ